MYFSRTITRLLSYVFYEDDPEHYTSGGAQVFVYGDRGYMFGIYGRGFFKAFPADAENFMTTHGLNSLEGYMSPSNARSVRMSFRTHPTIVVRIDPPTFVDGHKVQWVTTTLVGKGEVSSDTMSM